LSGPLGALFRAAGIGRSSRNPNLCNRCNTHTEEGRLVELTVLFADMSSFTELTHELGPERTHEVVDSFLKMATYALVKHGAFIDKYVGDAVMAFFNAPIRYQDHAARAAAAAREIQAEMPALANRFGLNLQAGVGIASGWARVGRLGSGDGKDYTAIGDVVNLAARLEGQARAGEIVLDGDVFRQVADHFPDTPAETLQLKGFSEPVSAYRLNSQPGAPAAHHAALYDDGTSGRRRSFSLGATLFALLGAPCLAASAIGQTAVLLGLGSLFGIGALATTEVGWLDAAWVRLPILFLSTLIALANLYVIWHARRLRQQAAAESRYVPVTGQERRRTVLVSLTSLATLFVVTYQFLTHELVVHQPWPFGP
jgi:adenylate cyclase